jgi:hypothetical protein
MKPDRPQAEHQLLQGLAPPPPPPELRARALAAAAARPASRGDVWARVWASRGLRLAWAAAVACLIAGHFLLSMPRTWTQAAAPSLATTPEVLEGDAGELLLPLRIAVSARPLLGRVHAHNQPSTLESERNPS